MADVEHVTCDELVQVLTEYLDGALEPGERADVERHIVICSGCANYVEQFGSTIELLALLADEEPGDAAPDAALEVFRAWRAQREARP